ncbi:Nacht domain protein [Rutstroemia sp. NJR-2017a BBW]|nr:Nacht domain protein [Rutstroemia sp. NJR-2017a BBW]
MASLADESYNNAVKHFGEKLTRDECKRIWLNDKHTIEDVQQAIEDAKTAYEAKGKDSKTYLLIQKFSSRVLHYADIFDTLAQHHPEYVSLVWGAIKFVFVGVVNHGELVAQLSKALSSIADFLPHVELKSVLYPTKRMSELVAIIYSQIIRFVIRAVNWYKEGRLKHMLTSITRPYALRFKDLLDDLRTSSRQLDQLAVAAAMVEQRDMHLEQKISHQILLEVRNMMQAQDFAVDVISLICESRIPVIWILNPNLSEDSTTAPTTIDILKHLVLQILQINQHRLTEKSLSLSATQFQCAKSEEEWFDLLVSALMGLPLLYIVVDLEVLKSAPAEKGLLVHGFLNLMKRLSSGSVDTVMKVVFISYFESVTSAADIPTNEVLRIPKATDTMYKSRKRNKRQMYTNRSKAISTLKLRF